MPDSQHVVHHRSRLDAVLAIGFWLLVCDLFANILIGPGIDVALLRYLFSAVKGLPILLVDFFVLIVLAMVLALLDHAPKTLRIACWAIAALFVLYMGVIG